jgi:hypothetical protein
MRLRGTPELNAARLCPEDPVHGFAAMSAAMPMSDQRAAEAV